MSQSTTFSEFKYAPGQPTPNPPAPQPEPPTDVLLGPLAGLQGSWSGSGFNTIWRPRQPQGGSQDRFLELNLTNETLDFDPEGLGSIPNRGFRQGDIHMGGVRYLQRISDANTGDGLHIEPGLWLIIEPTTAPVVPQSIARLASIPHGTTLLAQGSSRTVPGPPVFQPVSLNPFSEGQPPSSGSPFPEQDLGQATEFRTGQPGDNNISQAMIDNPNSVLAAAIAGQTITESVVLDITSASTPIIGGGTANTAFLRGEGATDALANANAALVSATFWIETLAGESAPTQLQYSQTVLLNFNGLSWPHVTVATLRKTPAAS